MAKKRIIGHPGYTKGEYPPLEHPLEFESPGHYRGEHTPHKISKSGSAGEQRGELKPLEKLPKKKGVK